MKIGVIGAGYVGLVAGVSFADAGHQVICADSNPLKIKSLLDGKVPFFEPGLQELLDLNKKRLEFTDSLEKVTGEASVIFLALNTPERHREQVDLTALYQVVQKICVSAKESKVLVLKSTVPIGTAAQMQTFANECSKHSIEIISNPEFLRQGSALQDFLMPDRVVVGTQSEPARKILSEVYSPIVQKNQSALIFMDSTSAEMAKYAANAFLALKISFINEMALLSDKVGADIDCVRQGFTSDHRINPHFFSPGIGYGGSCFSKDIESLVHIGNEYNLDLKLLKAVEMVNERQKAILCERLVQRFGNLNDLNIGILGLSFKPKTDDVRRAPSLDIIAKLYALGASVKAYDPVAGPNAAILTKAPFDAVDSVELAAENADCLLILTEWPEFKTIDFTHLKKIMRQTVIFDGRNFFDPEKMRSLGFEYSSIGKNTQVDGVKFGPSPENPVSIPSLFH